MKSYNSAPPAAPTQQLTQVVEIGWECDIVDGPDGRAVVYRQDENGEYIPRRVTVPVRITGQALLDGMRSLTTEQVELVQTGSAEGMVELLGAIIGRDTVLGVAATVDSDVFMEWVTDTVGTWGLDGALPDGRGN